MTDPLTGLYNRRGFALEREREFAHLQRSDGQGVFIMMDIDGLKGFNDSLGHPEGNEMLRKVAEILQTNFRKEDVIARIGGDEFALLCSGPVEGVLKAAGRVKDQIVNKYGAVGISASMGVAAFNGEYRDSDEWERLADECLLQAKKAGKNRIFTPDGEAGTHSKQQPGQ